MKEFEESPRCPKCKHEFVQVWFMFVDNKEALGVKCERCGAEWEMKCADKSEIISLKETVSIDKVIAYLNELIELDKPAIAALIANRVPCNERLAGHPSCQVGVQHGGYHVGMLGILNGMFGVDENGWGPITFVFEEGDLLRVERTKLDH